VSDQNSRKKGQERKGKDRGGTTGEEGRGEGSGRKGYPLQTKILAMAS